MKKLLTIALVATVITAPLANADDWRHNNHGHDPHGHQTHHAQQYPKGWGPHRGPDHGGYYHGYRGYHDHRAGYRRGGDGLWYPAAAFALCAIIGSTMNN
ncbi:hypothetical protein [Rhizobium sp. RAF56]|uniref:hypothetical protein n=1 Tax=Rhizobium sp. RAF56 TaxID=3233062 RepID=UPI003F984A7B